MKRRPGGRLRTSAPTSSSPAPYPSLPPERRKLAHFAASPLPNKAFGFAGGPIGFVAHTMQGPGVIGAARCRARRLGAPHKVCLLSVPWSRLSEKDGGYFAPGRGTFHGWKVPKDPRVVVLTKSAALRTPRCGHPSLRSLARPLPTTTTAQPLAALPPYGCGVPLAGTALLGMTNSVGSTIWSAQVF